MLSTKNLPESKGFSKTIQPGNILAKINHLALEKGYEEDTYNLVLFLETEDLGPEFEGFLIDKDNPSGPRYKGQVGKVKISPFVFTRSINGKPVDRDKNILAARQSLAIAMSKLEEVNEIEARTIEQYVPLAAKVLVGKKYINWCIAGKEYKNKENYTNYDLFLPKIIFKNLRKGIAKNEFPYEVTNMPEDKSELMKFDPAKHILKKKEPATVSSFAPAPVVTGEDDDDLPF